MNTDLLIIYIRNSRDIYALTGWLQKCFPIRIIKPQPSKKKNKQQENTRPILSDAWNIFLNSNNNYFSGAVMAPGYYLLSLFTFKALYYDNYK